MKLLPRTALTATAIAVAAVFALPTYAETPDCSFKGTEGCYLYQKNYTLSGNYQNDILSRVEMEKLEAEKRERSLSHSLFSIFGRANVVAKPNTVIKTDKSVSDYSVFNVHEAMLTLPAGTQIIVNPSFLETLTDKEAFLNDDEVYGIEAVFARDGLVNSQADIVINSMKSDAYNANPGTTMNLGGNITLNNTLNVGLQAHVDSVINFKDGTLTATDKADYAYALYVSEGAKINVTNSRIRMDHPLSALAGNGGGTINLTGSQAETAGVGVLHRDHIFYEEDIGHTQLDINLKNSTFGGKTALVAVNTQDNRWDRVFTENDIKFPEAFKINLNASEGSTLKGSVELNPSNKISDPAKQTQVNLNLNDSTWIYDKNSTITQLTAQQGKVVSDVSDGQFNTLTINGNLSGNAHFTLNTDLAAQQGDKVVVKGQTDGAHTITVQNSKNEPKSSGGRLTLVETNGGSGTFALSNNNGRNYVDAGAFRYDFKQEGNNWVLANAATSEPVKPVEQPAKPVQPTEPVKPVEPAQPVQPIAPVAPVAPVVPVAVPVSPSQPEPVQRTLSNYTNAPLGYVQAASTLVQQQHTALNQRQSQYHQPQGRLNGLWVQGDYGRSKHDAQNVGHQAQSAGFTMRHQGFQIGYDRQVGRGYVGILAGSGNGSLDYNGDYASTDLKQYSAGIYGGIGFGNGWFADSTYRYSRFKAETGDDNTRLNAHSLNVQGGKIIGLSNVWSLVPQAALTVTRLSGHGESNGATLLHSRLGADVQAGYALANGVRLKPSVGVHYLGDHNRAKVDFNGYRFDVPNNGHRVALRASVDAAISPASNVNINLQTEHGKDYRRPLTAEVGYQYRW